MKIFDFGMARSVHPVTGKIVGEEEEMICGTPRYFAPEIFDFSGGSKQTDVYAFGIMLHEICSMSVPFGEMDEFEEFREHVCAGGRPNIWEIPDEATREVIRDCTLEDAEARPSFRELRTHRLPKLLVEKTELESPRAAMKSKIGDSARTGATEVLSPGGSRGFSVSRRNSGTGTSIGSLDLDENDDVGHDCSLPQEFDDVVPRRSPASNQSMPRMRCGDEEASVNSRGLGRSTRSTTTDFLSSDFMLAENDYDCTLTDEQKRQRQERLQRQLAKKKKPRRRRLKGEERQKKQNKEREELRRLSLAHLEDIRRQQGDDDVGSRDSGSDTDLNMNPPIPRNLTYDESDDDSVSFADDVISLNDEAASLNDCTILLNDAVSIISRVSDDSALDLTQDEQDVGQEIPLPPPPPPPLPTVTPRNGLDSSAHGTRKKRRKKKKGMDGSTHSAYSSVAVSLADDALIVSGVNALDFADIQPPPPPPPLPTVTPRDGLGSSAHGTKTKRRKKKKELDSSTHSVNGTVMVSLADDRSVASIGTRTRKKKTKKDKGMDSSTHSALSSAMVPLTDDRSVASRTRKKKKKKDNGIDLSGYSAFSTANKSSDDEKSTVKLGASGDALEASDGESPPPPPPPPLPPPSPQLSTVTKTRRKKKKKDKGMDLSDHSVFSTKSVKSEENDALLLDSSQHQDGLTPRTRRKKKKKGGKKKDLMLSWNSNHTRLETIASPEVCSPKNSRSKTPKSTITRKKDKLELKMVEMKSPSQPAAPLDPATVKKEDAAPCPVETNPDAMLQKNEDLDDPPKEEPPQNFSWWTIPGMQ